MFLVRDLVMLDIPFFLPKISFSPASFFLPLLLFVFFLFCFFFGRCVFVSLPFCYYLFLLHIDSLFTQFHPLDFSHVSGHGFLFFPPFILFGVSDHLKPVGIYF